MYKTMAVKFPSFRRYIHCNLWHIQATFILLIFMCALVTLYFHENNSDSVIRSTPSKPFTPTDKLPTITASYCLPIKHIYYLKTHKTASSTIGTILLTYGITKQQRIVLDPDLADEQWPALLKLNEVSRLIKSDTEKIFSTHIRFNKEPINKVFPRTKAKYITILRNPVDRFKSALMFYKKITRVSKVSDNERDLNAFFKSSSALQETRSRLSKTRLYREYNHVSNSNLFDMGLEQEDFKNMTLVKSYINEMENEFDLVMIADYFDESLILLKRLLCWEFEDIVYIKLRVENKKIKFEEQVKRNILTWNHADAMLFDHFNKTFWRKVLQAGPSFYEDLKTFRRINQEFQATCESFQRASSFLSRKIPLKPERLLLRKKCTLLKTPTCDILEQLWRKRGNTFSGYGCGPNPREIAKQRLKSAETFKFS